MRASLVAVLIVCLATDAVAAPRGCFTVPEHQAEQEIRHGIRLREGATECDAWVPGLTEVWRKIDQTNGNRFAAQTKLREAAFAREFESWSNTYRDVWDGRIVMYFRNYPVTDAHCRQLAKQLDEVLKKGYRAFKEQASLLRNEVRMDYRTCG
ncbi:MAG: hypothetical protein HQL40_11030 [Alphaproteobacteria bacterium]|nr:hypothetical protein [Alphaproteobacteria bacterium]